VTHSSSFNIFVASLVPTTQGVPSSLEIIAAWQVSPPSSVMIAAAFFIAGTMSGVVIFVTKISPSIILPISSISVIIFTFPASVPGDAPIPFNKIFPSISFEDFDSFFSFNVVIGLACNM